MPHNALPRSNCASVTRSEGHIYIQLHQILYFILCLLFSIRFCFSYQNKLWSFFWSLVTIAAHSSQCSWVLTWIQTPGTKYETHFKGKRANKGWEQRKKKKVKIDQVSRVSGENHHHHQELMTCLQNLISSVRGHQFSSDSGFPVSDIMHKFKNNEYFF